MKFLLFASLVFAGPFAISAPVLPDCPLVEKQDARGNISLLSPLQTTISKREKKIVEVNYAGYSGLIFLRADYVTFQKVLVQAAIEGKMIYIGAVGPQPVGIADEVIPDSCLPKKNPRQKKK